MLLQSSQTAPEGHAVSENPRTWKERAFRILQCALGVLLLAAAGLKGHELLTNPFAATTVISSNWIHVAVIEFEIVLGLWFLSGRSPVICWVLGLVFFSFLAFVSLYLGLVLHSQSC